MNNSPTFSGFPEAGLQFLAGLSTHNNKEWFEAHKQDFQRFLIEPAQAFVLTLGERLQTLSPDIIYDTRLNGSGSLSRIYRDTRFSKDKRPYHTYLNIVFWEGTGKKMENPGYHFHFDAEGGVMRQGIYQFSKEQLATYRDTVIDDTLGKELALAIGRVKEAGYRIGGEHYSRVPRGYDSNHPRADLLRYNGLGAHSPQISRETLLSSDLVEVCFEHCRHMAPLQQWLVELKRYHQPV